MEEVVCLREEFPPDRQPLVTTERREEKMSGAAEIWRVWRTATFVMSDLDDESKLVKTLCERSSRQNFEHLRGKAMQLILGGTKNACRRGTRHNPDVVWCQFVLLRLVTLGRI